MSQLKFYKYATFGLLFLNIGVLAFFLLAKPGPRPPASPANFRGEVIKILDLNSEQERTFTALAEDHNRKMNSLNEQQRKLLRPYFENLNSPDVRINKEDVLNQVQQLEGEKMEVTYQHFQDLKSILSESQLPHFERFIRRFMDRVFSSPEKSTPPPKGLK